MYRPCGVFDKTYLKDITIIRTWQHWAWVIGALLLLYLLPVLGFGYYLISLINSLSITIIAVMGLQIVTGYCGQISFGQPAFMAVGGFTSAILMSQYGLSFWLALPLSGVVAGLVGIIGGAPSLRIKGFYLAMATLAMHFLIMWLILHMKITGGAEGIVAPFPKIGDFELDSHERMYYLIITVMIIMTYAARNLVRSKIGRAFVAIRDNDLAAEMMGVNLYYYKLLAFFISCFYAGVAGALFVHLLTVGHPEQFPMFDAIWYIGMIIVGGMGSIPGVFFGVIFLRMLDELVLFGSPILAELFPWLGDAPASSMGLIAFGCILMAFLIFEPRGLAHRWEIIKASYRVYPFAY
ncbi:MAG: branched-chain amino acid ABC transporter permease [Proteobacteria bacterium]|nr:branched-chain amino acid ABC transporter permease [Pseudomonadota bacterium]